MSIPLPLTEIINNHTALYVCYLITKYFTTEAHPGQRYVEYASAFDRPFAMDNPGHLEAVVDIGKYYNGMQKIAQPLTLT
jgi:hypothetical protein